MSVPSDATSPSKFLQNMMISLTASLFPEHAIKINEEYFPFVTDGFEIEVKYDREYLEILGGGVMHPYVKRAADVEESASSCLGFGAGTLSDDTV